MDRNKNRIIYANVLRYAITSKDANDWSEVTGQNYCEVKLFDTESSVWLEAIHCGYFPWYDIGRNSAWC